MHDILASVHVASDVDRAVDCAVMSGEITPDVREDVRRLLSERIAAHSEWFPESGEYRVLNERTVFRKDGAQRRPDRVIISSDGVRIVDFKFGEERMIIYVRCRGMPAYISQWDTRCCPAPCGMWNQIRQ